MDAKGMNRFRKNMPRKQIVILTPSGWAGPAGGRDGLGTDIRRRSTERPIAGA